MNDDREKRQFRQADVAVERAVAAFMKSVGALTVRWEAVLPSYIAERVLLELCAEMSRLTDDPVLRNHAGPATLKLANALANYRDSQWAER